MRGSTARRSHRRPVRALAQPPVCLLPSIDRSREFQIISPSPGAASGGTPVTTRFRSHQPLARLIIACALGAAPLLAAACSEQGSAQQIDANAPVTIEIHQTLIS